MGHAYNLSTSEAEAGKRPEELPSELKTSLKHSKAPSLKPKTGLGVEILSVSTGESQQGKDTGINAL